MFACCMAGDADGGELDLGTPKRARSRPTRSGRKVRVKKAVRTGGAARKMEDGTVVQSDGSKVLADGTKVEADAAEVAAREEKRKRAEQLEVEAEEKRKAAEEEAKRKAEAAAAEAEAKAAERKRALEEQHESLEEDEYTRQMEELEKELEEEEELRRRKEQEEFEKENEELDRELLEEMGYDEDDIQELIETFRMFDKDGNGFIDKHELGEVMKSMGEEYDDDELDEMLQDADTDEDGRINYNEFALMMM
mmetsp:Transcript_124873/g.176199  ORF Transcript_124873/g.176199 Transcript_124873/m.176199 type:complete len:251 (-) Transcript_124873:106-858(-)